MFNIDHNLTAFIVAVRSKKSLKCTSEGLWSFVNPVVHWFQRLLGRSENSELALLRGFRNALARLETIPIRFLEDGVRSPQVINYQLYVVAAEALVERAAHFSSKSVLLERLALMRDLVALRYRLEEVNGGLNPAEPSEELLCSLTRLAKDWKLSSPLFHNRTLSQLDKHILREACQYTEFVKIMLVDRCLLEVFLIWALRDRISIHPFIQYPSLQKEIFAAGLNGRIGRMGGDLLKIQLVRNPQQPTGVMEKVVTLPFEGREITLLNPRRVVLFRGNYALTIAEIFEVFKDKEYKPGNLEFMADGIVNWNDHFWGWWDEDAQSYHMVDLEQEEWWKQLPLHEVLTLKQAREKYGAHLDGRQWNFATIATRVHQDLDPEHSHAYTSIAIPLGDSRYAIYPFGKYAFRFPSSFIEAVKTLADTVEATVAYPDENVYYTQRQRTRLSYAFTEAQGLAYMDSVRKDMISSRGGNFVYQLEAENCAKWVQNKMEDVLGRSQTPNLFRIAYLECQPRGFMGVMFAIVKSLPLEWQTPITLLCHLPFGAYRGKWIWEHGKRVWKSLTHHAFWEDTTAYLPAMLYKKQEEGIIRRCVAGGLRYTAARIQESYEELALHFELACRGIVAAVAKRFQPLTLLVRANHLGSFQTGDQPFGISQRGSNSGTLQPHTVGMVLAHSKGLQQLNNLFPCIAKYTNS